MEIEKAIKFLKELITNTFQMIIILRELYIL